ncbi:uncharacterized protein NECHADRAFT_87792 [Fusarium vanettenii 77-13-4]|uniref:CBM-cenC domain-containing protein n=1 Tax=Fusarium vanettenii (strain ATCC MYA-4622 / CBS 123669 / FGSC 9596 / NRRL 45880 / 77-13-4) TaxID=660122 RepID=C7Z316_FUSV7|nr:uncharacterized protein NECHADRAFT_87792 [Fusarium vanettenii 77-13-4]EEU41754.1 predicted protein [Fusarium vanettenii 77-13-4]
MALRKALAACAALALVGVDASVCRPQSSDAISSSTVIESSTIVATSSTTESSTVASSTTISEQVSSSATVSEEASSSTTESSEASSSTVETSTTSTTAAPTSTGYLSNPGFVDNGAGWTFAGQASASDQYWYHDAVGAAYLSVTATGQDAGASISTPLRNLVPGQDYVVSMYWRLNWWAYADVCSYVFFIDDQEHTNTVQMMNGWQQLSASFTAPKADPELKIQLWCSAIPDNGESDWEPLVNAYVDDVAIAESN